MERRNDVGSKIIWVLISALISIIMTITWVTANSAQGSVQNNALEIRELKTNFFNIQKALDGIQQDVKKLLIEASK